MKRVVYVRESWERSRGVASCQPVGKSVLSQFLFEVICGMISRCEQRCVMRESDDGSQFQRCPFPKEVILMGVRWSVAYPLICPHSLVH
jgi:hypothetical protein